MGKKTSWWKPEYDAGWERIKEAFRRDWQQTKHDFGALAPDLHQNADDTVRQALGFDEHEHALRYGYGAHQHYQERPWSEQIDSELRDEYPLDYDRDREFIRYSYQNAATVGLHR